MPLNKRQLARAVRLYGLAVLSNQDCGGADTENERAVMQGTIDAARDALRRLGYVPTELHTISQCIEAAAVRRLGVWFLKRENAPRTGVRGEWPTRRHGVEGDARYCRVCERVCVLRGRYARIGDWTIMRAITVE
jgi:hypothetical protein